MWPSGEKLRMYGVGGSQARATAAGCAQLGGRISRFDKLGSGGCERLSGEICEVIRRSAEAIAKMTWPRSRAVKNCDFVEYDL